VISADFKNSYRKRKYSITWQLKNKQRKLLPKNKSKGRYKRNFRNKKMPQWPTEMQLLKRGSQERAKNRKKETNISKG
jgi:hypothetical protein